MSHEPDQDDAELRRLHSEVDARERDIHEMGEYEHRQETLIALLREQAEVRDDELAILRERLGAAEQELEDLRAIRDALTPAELPRRPGLELAAAFVRTALAATAPYSDDPCQVLSWANTALVERAGTGTDFVTAACVTYLPEEKLLRWSYAGHPPALTIDDGRELVAPRLRQAVGV